MITGGARGVTRVFCEGGPRVAGAPLKSLKGFDRVRLAPVAHGVVAAPTAGSAGTLPGALLGVAG